MTEVKRSTYICESCGLVKEDGTRVVETSEMLRIRNENVVFPSYARVCTNCDKGVSDETLDGVTLLQAYAVYRERHSIIAPEEIKAMRESYGLSQRRFSALLGMGEISYHRYENGSLPDTAHATLLRLVQNPRAMLILFEQKREKINPSAQTKVEANIKHAIEVLEGEKAC